MEISPLAWNLLFALVVAAFSAWVTVHLTLRRFRTEKWWELKAETYQNIMDALFSLDRYFKRQEYTEVTGNQLDEDELNELLEEWNDASYELDRVVFLGEFAISPESVEILNNLNMDLQNAAPPDKRFGILRTQERYNFFRKQRKRIQGALMEVRSTAKKQLKVN